MADRSALQAWFRTRADRARARPGAVPATRVRLMASVLLIFAASMLVACTTAGPAEGIATTTTFVIVRHAEKGTDDAKDPSLSKAGRMRAQQLARLLSGSPLVAAYATDYRRTRQTAAPAAEAHGITVTTYDAQSPAAALASRLRAAHSSGTVLVVGHSNTVPDIAAALSGQAVDAMADDRFDLIYRITVRPDGKVELVQSTY